MRNNKKYLVLIILAILLKTELFAENSTIDSINDYFVEIINSNNDQEKEIINDKLIYLFSTFLSDNESFNTNFSEIPYINALKSSDNKLNVITWNLAFRDGTFKYFGFLQYKNRNNVNVFFLQDRKYYNEQISSEENTKTGFSTNSEWYGSLYYEIITKKDNSKTYYTLLGWDGANYKIDRKVIEVLHFSRNKPVFGGKVFKQDKLVSGRIVYEFANNTYMMMRYSEKMDMIILDHLSPSEEKFVGIYSFYGPDFTYDSFTFQGGRWVLISNIDVTPAMPYIKKRNISYFKRLGFSKDF